MSMELDHSFTVPVPPDRAWDVLLDVERIAPCMPGATVEEFDGEVVTGRIKIKVGPVALTYRGTAKFTERDPVARVLVVDAAGKETRGAGTAAAAIRASLEPAGEGTQVLIRTTMNVTGRPAQFGRGVIAEVGGKLIEKFAENLAQLISDGGGQATPDDAGLVTDATADAEAAEAEGVAAEGAAAEAVPAEAVPAEDVEAEDDDVTITDLPAVHSPAVDSAAEAAELDAEDVDVTMIDLPAVQAPPVASMAEPTAVPPEPTASTEPALAPAAAAAPAPAAPVRAPAPARAQAPDEDSINLIRLAGPAILKRVLPIAVGAAVVALLGRRWLRRGKKS